MKPSELAKELGVTPQKVGLTRKKLGLPKGVISEAEADMIREELAEHIEDIGPKFCFGMVMSVQSGTRRIGCKVQQSDGTYKEVPAFVPLEFDPTGLKGKKIKLEYIDYNGKRFYRHAALAAKTWRVMSPELRDL